MPEIRTYEQQYLPQGTYNAQASPDQMGAGIGQAISDLGETFQKIEQDKGETWAYKNAGDLFDKLKQNYNDEIAKLDPRDPEYLVKVNNVTANYKPQIAQATSSLMEQAPSGYARKALDKYMLQNSRALMGEAVQRQASISAEYMRSQLEDTIVQDARSIAGDPSDANFNRVLQNRREMIANIKNPDITPEMKIKWLQDTTRTLALAQGGALARDNPDFFLKSISPDGGKIAAPRGDGTPFGDAVAFVLEKEGGYTPSDGESGAPANFGINQRANPDIDVKNLTQDRAVQIYKERYWNAIGGDSLPKPMAMVAFNVAVNMGVGAAKDLLEKSGGDPTRFTALAKQRYMDIAANNPKQEKYLAGWLARADATLAAAGAPRNILPQVKMLSDEQIASSSPSIAGAKYLTPQDVWSLARTAEGQMSQRLSIEQAELSRDIKDVAAVLGDGKSYPGIDDGRFSEGNLKRVFGEVKGKEVFTSIEKMKTVSPVIASLAKMPNAQAEEALAKFAPKEGPGYAADKELYNALATNFAGMQDKRKKDYMGWALSTEGTNVKPIDSTSTDKLRESLVARIPAAIAARQSHGVAAPMLSIDEASALGNQLSRLNPDDAMFFLKEMRRAMLNNEDLYTQMMGQLAPKVPNFAIAGNIAIKKGQVDTGFGVVRAEDVAQKIIAGSFILKGNGVDANDKTPSPVKFDQDKINAAFDSVIGRKAFALPDEKMAAQLRSQTLGAVTSYVAALAAKNGGGEISDSQYTSYVTEAAKAVTGGVSKPFYWDGGQSVVLLPWGMDDATFQNLLPVAAGEAVKKTPPALALPPNPRKWGYINSNRDGEYIIVDPASGRVVPGMNGKSITVRINKPKEQLPDFYGDLGLPGMNNGR